MPPRPTGRRTWYRPFRTAADSIADTAPHYGSDAPAPDGRRNISRRRVHHAPLATPSVPRRPRLASVVCAPGPAATDPRARRVRPMGAARRAADAALTRRPLARLWHHAGEQGQRAQGAVERWWPRAEGHTVRRATRVLGRLALAGVLDRVLRGA